MLGCESKLSGHHVLAIHSHDFVNSIPIAFDYFQVVSLVILLVYAAASELQVVHSRHFNYGVHYSRLRNTADLNFKQHYLAKILLECLVSFV